MAAVVLSRLTSILIIETLLSKKTMDSPGNIGFEDDTLSSTGDSDHNSTEGPSASKRAKRSIVHQHFEPVGLIGEKGTGEWKCKHCGGILQVKSHSTSTRLRHLKSLHPTTIPISEIKAPQTFSAKIFQEKLLATIVLECLPFSIVDSNALKDLLKYCNSEVTLPSRFKIKEDITARFNAEKAKLIENLQKIPGKMSCIIDNWTSSNMHPYQGVIVQYIDEDWEMCSIVLDLTILKGSHTGIKMADALIKVLDEFNITKKIISITTDNASNNNTMLQNFTSHMKQEGVAFDAQDNHVRCFAHIVNLACVAAFDEIKKVAPHDYGSDSEDDGDEISLITKMRGGIKSIRKSHIKKEKFKSYCESEKIKYNELLLDVKTRWNSTYDMIQRCLNYKLPYNYTLKSDNECSKYLISEAEFEILEDIAALLMPFKEATTDISEQKCPTISLCALIYLQLFNHLETFFPNKSNKFNPINKITKKEFPTWLQTAAESAWKKLDDYYPTSDGLVYVIGSVMDPRCKLQWFKDHFPKEIVNSYSRVIKEYWKTHYQPGPEEATLQSASPRSNNPWARHFQEKRASEKKDELEVYLLEKTAVNPDKTALEWWKLHDDEFPNLSKMARDFLCISGSGVPVECLFSNGPDLLRNRRQSLSDETIRKCICLKIWLSKSSEYTIGKAVAQKMGGPDE